MLKRELFGYWNERKGKVYPDQLVRYLDSRCANKEYNREVVKVLFEKINERDDETVSM